MARVRTSLAFLLGCVAVPGLAAAQATAFVRDDFASVSGARALASADFNRDGWPDLAQANGDRNSVTILLSVGGAHFVKAFDITVGTGPFDLTTGDFNRDGAPDLAVANADGNSISLLIGRGNGSFNRRDIAAPSQNPRGVTTGDINNDGRLDLIYTGFATGTVRTLVGDGNGFFSAGPSYTAAGTQPQGVAVGDLTHRGHLDVVVACKDGLRILSGMEGSSISVRTVTRHTNLNVVALADLNRDGWLDVAAASTTGNDVSVYLGGSAGLAFSNVYAVGSSPRGVAIADVSGDGRGDIVTANRSSSTISVLTGSATQAGAFNPSKDFAAASGTRAVVVADLNGDGRVDVATGNQFAATVTVLSNVTALKKAAFAFTAQTIKSTTPLAAQDFLSPESRFSPVPQIATADFNRDGKLDLVVPAGPTTNSNTVLVLLRNGSTVKLTGPAPLTRFVVDDFNADGNPDVLYYSSAANTASSRFITYLGNGRGQFTASTTTSVPESLEWCGSGDLNRDARPDLVCDNIVLVGRGDGTFRPLGPFAEPGEGARLPGPSFADVNRDGNLDVIGTSVFLGDGTGALTAGSPLPGPVHAAVDLDRNGFVDLVVGDPPDSLIVIFGGSAGFTQQVRYPVLEDLGAVKVTDINLDGHPDIVINGSTSIESAGLIMFLIGSAESTFTPDRFLLRPGQIVVTDINSDGLPDIASYDAQAVHVLVNQRTDTNHRPLVPDYSLTSGVPCLTLEAKVSEVDQQAMTVDWFDPSGTLLSSGRTGDDTGQEVCVTQPGTYKFRRTATDTRGASASGIVTLTYQQALKEIVLYAAAGNVQMSGTWTRVADSTAAGGVRAYDRNAGAAKVTQPSPAPTNAITIPFVADPNLAYKLWIRLRADNDSWANDSVWVQFTGGATAPYTVGTPIGLTVSLEECSNCGVSGWGWQDDGYGSIDRLGVLLHFDPGPQTIVIQTREDGVSVDQIVLSAEKYLSMRPGAAKNDQTILPATEP